MIQAVLSNKEHPEYGVATIPFPIERDEYDHCIGLVEALEIGNASKQDCQVDEIIFGAWPVLKRLENTQVNLDELDYLAKRLDSFDVGEAAQFQAMAEKLDLHSMKDLINLTFCCQQATVITDFSDLDAVGRDHYMNLHGGCASVDELEALDGYETALLLIDSGAGVITPYGVVYDNGMQLEQLYDGKHLPGYHYEPDALMVGLTSRLEPEDTENVIHYHANIHKALKYAVKIEMIDSNPADKVERPKKNRFVGSFYDSEEVQKLFEAAKGSKLEIPIFLGAFYGLRRSEALGLRWDAIDFQNDTITIRHTVTSCNIDGKRIQVAQDTTKTKSSMRTLPLVPVFKDKLLALKEQQVEYKRVCGRCYDKRYLDYICVDEMGTLVSPQYLTTAFPKLLERNGLRHIRYHDLRHSCASLLLANGVPMKQIQEWLGHSDFSTTANVYAHLDYNSKLSSADAMVNGLKGALGAIS